MRNRRRLARLNQKRWNTIGALEAVEARVMLSADVMISNIWDNAYNQYTPGVPIQYTITLDNVGTTSVSGAQITESVPTGINFSTTVSKSLRSSSSTSANNLTAGAGGGVYQSAGADIVWNLPSIAAGAKVSVSAVLVPTTTAIAPSNPLNTITTTATLTTPGVTNTATGSQLTASDTANYQEAANSSAVTIQSSANPSVSGNLVTFTATVSSGTTNTILPTGTVQFYDGSTVLGAPVTLSDGTASYKTSSLVVGAHNLTASYSGDSNYQPSTSGVFSQVVQASSPTPPTPTPVNAIISMSISAAEGTVKNPTLYTPGTFLTYTVSVTNSDGSSLAGTSSVTYNAPTGYSITNATLPSGDTFTSSSSQVVFDLINLAAGTTSMTVTIYAAAPSPITSYTTSGGNVTGPAPVSGVNSVSAPVAAPVLSLPSGVNNTSSSAAPTLTIPVPAYVVSMTDSITLPSITPSVYSYYAGTTVATEGETCVAYTLRQLVNYYDSYLNATNSQNGLNGAFDINLNGGTYSFISSGSSKSNDRSYQLEVNNPNNQGSGRALEISNGTINANHDSRAISIAQGQNLYLNNVVVENGIENGGTSNVSTTGRDAFGGGIYVSGGGSLFLQKTTLKNCQASAEAGVPVTTKANSTRAGVGYTAAGGGIYGAAGSSISVDGKSVLTGNTAIGGHGAAVDNAHQTTGGMGGAAYGGAIAIDAPASGPTPTAPTSVSTLTMDGGAVISKNRLNRVLNQAGTKTLTYGGTGGTITNGKGTGGSGGNAYGAGLYMFSGNLVLNGGSKDQPVSVSSNYQSPGEGAIGTSVVSPGSAGSSYGAIYLEPGEVSVSNSPASGGIFSFGPAIPVGNFGFETPGLGSGNFEYQPSGSNLSWAFTSGAGVSNNSSGFTSLNQNSPQGTQVGFIQDVSTISQTITGLVAGRQYQLSFDAATRVGYSQSEFEVVLNGAASPPIYPATIYQPYTLTFTPSSSSETLAFSGIDTSGADQTTFLDNVSVVQVSQNESIVNQTATAVSLYLPAPLTTTADAAVSGTGLWNLRTAITAANQLSNSGMAITLGLTTGTYTLTQGSLPITSSGTGSLTLQGTGDGTGSTATIISGNDSSTVGSILSIANASVGLKQLTIENGKASTSGGGIYALNTNALQVVALTSASVSNNTASSSGGGIYQSGGTLFLKNSSVKNNSSGTGAGIDLSKSALWMTGGTVSGNIASVGGGGFYAFSTSGATTTPASLTNVTVSGNKANNGTGGGIEATNVALTLTNDTFTTNTATGNGGAVFVDGSANLRVNGGTYGGSASTSANSAANGGGFAASYGSNANPKVTISNANIASNSASGSGGGVYQSAGNLTLKKSQLQKNLATKGGGIALNGAGVSARVSNDTLSSNSASTSSGTGGGIYQSAGTLALNSDTLKANQAYQGGGIYTSGTIGVNNATITKNAATSSGAGFEGTGAVNAKFTNAKVSSNSIAATGTANGAGLYLSGGTLVTDGITVSHNSIKAANNVTIQGGGIYASGTPITFNGGTTSATNIADNQLIGDGSGTAFGAGICLVSGASISIQSVITYSSNSITQTASGVGGAIAFFNNTSYTANYSITSTGNSANAGGADYAIVVPSLSDNADESPAPSGPSGVNYLTSGAGSLRSAVTFADSWMNNNSNNHSVALILPNAGAPNSSGTNAYVLDEYGSGSSSTSNTLVTSVPSNDTLSIIGESTGGNATIQGFNAQTLDIVDSGSLVLQNLNIVGGDAVNRQNGTGGGIYQASGTTTLNNVLVTANSAGYSNTPAAPAGANSGATAADYNGGHAANGANGVSGATGYGGGIYLNAGTLNLLANCSITGNYVYGQNGGGGGSGQKGYVNFHVDTCDAENTSRVNGGEGGNGGSGGQALGGGLYQAAGSVINSPSGSSIIIGNNSSPGVGGNGGAGGGSGSTSHDECSYNYNRTSSGGSAGIGGNSTAQNPQTGEAAYGSSNYENGGSGHTALTAASIVSPMEAAMEAGGLYQSTGSLNLSEAPASVAPGGISGITVELYSDNGTLLATTQTDSKGRYFFDTTFTGMGYIQVVKPAIYEVVAKDSNVGGVKSQLDPHTLRSDSTQFVDGFAVNGGLSFALKKAPIVVKLNGNSLVVSRSDTGQTLFTDQLMPKSYKGGFTATKYDFNGDHTDDYVLITKKGTPQLFIIDGRSGAVTHINGAIAPALLQPGMTIQPVNLTGGSDQEFLLLPAKRAGKISAWDPSDGTGNFTLLSSSNEAGKVTAIDLTTKSVLWTAPSLLSGRMTVNTVSTTDPSRPTGSDVTFYSHYYPDTFATRDGATGMVTLLIFEGIEVVNSGGMLDPDPHYQELDHSQQVALHSLAKALGLKLTPGINPPWDTDMLRSKIHVDADMASAKLNSHVTSMKPAVSGAHPTVAKGVSEAASLATHDAALAKISVRDLHREPRLAESR